MRRFVPILSLLVLVCNTSFAPIDPVYSYEFAIRINPSGTSLVNTAIVTISDKKIVKVETINEQQFLMEIAGVIESKANRAPEDLFRKNGIRFCSQERDTITWTYKKEGEKRTGHIVEDKTVSCPLLAEVWKVRYKHDIRKKNYNYNEQRKPEGWSADKFWPNLAQVNYLKATYGADGINDFIYGEKLFRFLKDVQDTSWVNMYKALK